MRKRAVYLTEKELGYLQHILWHFTDYMAKDDRPDHGLGILKEYRDMKDEDRHIIFCLAGRLRRLYNKKTMKKLLAIICVTMFFATSHAQNTLYATFQPDDKGVGIRYDWQSNAKNGLYTSISYGNYKFLGGYINDHVKIALGGIAYTEYAFITFGVAYNDYGKSRLPEDFNETALQRFTSEVGVGTKLGKVSVAVIMDVFKWESGISIGINF